MIVTIDEFLLDFTYAPDETENHVEYTLSGELNEEGEKGKRRLISINFPEYNFRLVLDADEFEIAMEAAKKCFENKNRRKQ